MAAKDEWLAIGHLAERTGLAVSAVRFYESEGLIEAVRNQGGQRRFRRSELRKLSFIMIAQGMGFPLAEIKSHLAGLPQGRAPTAADWARIGRTFRAAIDARIATLAQMRDRLDGCIGCGCLSLKKCALYNPLDRAANKGRGPRYLMGDRPG